MRVGPREEREGLVSESEAVSGKQLSREWLEDSRKRLEIAYQTRHSNPKITMEIVMQILDELLQRLPRIGTVEPLASPNSKTSQLM